MAELPPSVRHDVGQAFPAHARACQGGFYGDLVVPVSYEPGRAVDIRIESERGSPPLHVASYACSSSSAAPARVRAYDLHALLQDPASGVSLAGQELGDDGARDSGTARMIAGVPHFHPAGHAPVFRLSEDGTTHPYSAKARELIASSAGLVLDYGAGIKPLDQLCTRAVNLDVFHYRNIDVVSSYPTLPFKDGIFELVVSQAVFEHLADPRRAARECFRVLEPGGRLLVETAFMQPLHGDPSHFFNMTAHGLREVLGDFTIEDIGVLSHQQPSYGLMMQLEAVLPLIKRGAWATRLSAFVNELHQHGEQLDADLGELGREILAAGVYAVARKKV
jgi:SAM-dependent methyltransferase